MSPRVERKPRHGSIRKSAHGGGFRFAGLENEAEGRAAGHRALLLFSFRSFSPKIKTHKKPNVEHLWVIPYSFEDPSNPSAHEFSVQADSFV